MSGLFEFLSVMLSLGMIGTVITIFVIFMRYIKQKEDAIVALYDEHGGY